jgi:hypothetical protein
MPNDATRTDVMRWGPTVASVVSAVALCTAALAGIRVTAGDEVGTFGLVHLDGLVGETTLVMALAVVGFSIGVAIRRVPPPAFIAIGLVAVVSVFVTRASVRSDAGTVDEYIASQGSADGIDSALARLMGGSITDVDVGGVSTLLATAAAAALVAVGWAAYVALDDRRRPSLTPTVDPDDGHD